jgi:hypothetical protein
MEDQASYSLDTIKRGTPMKWIRVEDRLPEECEPVLIYSKGFAPTGAYLIYEGGSPIFWHVNDWDESDITYRWNEVTHWMPLPKEPDEMD